MDTSKTNDTRGIVPLTAEEIEWVSAGKSVVPTRTFMESFTDWLHGAGDFPQITRIPASQLTDLQQATLGAGGSFYRNASMLITIMRADGTDVTLEVG